MRHRKCGVRWSLWRLGANQEVPSETGRMRARVHARVPSLLGVQPWTESRSDRLRSPAAPSCSARTLGLVCFLYSCVSRVCKPHTILPPASLAKNKAETVKSTVACGQAPCRLPSLPLELLDWPRFFPGTLGVKVVGTSRLRKGKAHSLKDGQLVSVYRKSSQNPSVQIPPPPHTPPRISPAKFWVKPHLEGSSLKTAALCGGHFSLHSGFSVSGHENPAAGQACGNPQSSEWGRLLH